MFKPKYFLYARKSTEDDDKQVMSIEAQLYEMREFAHKENLEILSEFQESKSAKTPGRPMFNEMMSKIENMDGVGILAWHPDRLARNSIDGGRVIYAVDQKKVVSLRFPTFWFEPTPQGLFMLQVAFGQSKYYSDNLVQNVKRGIRAKLRRGEWLTLAPFGYINNPKTRNIEPHPTYARIIKLAYQEYATGNHTLTSLAHFLAEHSLVSRRGTPLGKTSVQRILTNRAYIGFTKYKGEWYEGSFAPILSPKLFEAVQKILFTKAKPRKIKDGHNFPFANLFRCGECDSMFTAQWATGRHGHRYRYYRCTKKKGNCSQRYLQEGSLVNQIREQLQTISLCDRYTDCMLEQVEKMKQDDETLSHSLEQKLSKRIKDSEARMEKLVATYLDGDIPKTIYLTQKDKIMRATLSLREKKKVSAQEGQNWNEPLTEFIKSIKQANFLTTSGDFKALADFVKDLRSNPHIMNKTAHLAMPSPYNLISQGKGNFAAARSAGRSDKSDKPLTREEVLYCGPDRI